MKVLITGGLGFIGSNLVARLVELNYQVNIIDNLINGDINYLGQYKDHINVKIFIGDILNKDEIVQAMTGVEFVFHLSANSDIARSAVDTDIDVKQTILGTHSVLEAMRKCKVYKIAYTSGSGVYGDLGQTAPDESYGPLRPVSLYGATKASAEALISSYVDLYNYKATIFRFANVVGLNQTHGICFDLIRKLKHNSISLDVLGNGSQFKSYVQVSDIISAVILAIESQESNYEVYNVSNINGISVKDIAEMVVEKMGLNKNIIKYGLSNKGWPGDVPLVLLNDRKIRKLGWSQKLNSIQAIDQSIEEILKQYD